MSQVGIGNAASQPGVVAFLEGNTGGAVGPDGSNIIHVIGAGTLSVAGNPGTNTLTINESGAVATTFVSNSGTATPSANTLNVLGAVVAAGTNPFRTIGSGNTLTGQVQISQAIASTDASKIGLSNFNSAQFSVDANGFVALVSPAPAWTDVTGTTQAMAVNQGYTANNAGLVTFTLPSTAAYGTTLAVVGKGAGGWSIVENSGQNIHFGSSTTTTTTGSLSSTNQYDVVYLLCTVANTTFTVTNSVGNITVV